MSYITPPPVKDGTPLDLKVGIDPDDHSIYIKIAGFDTHDDADEYANFLADSLSLNLSSRWVNFRPFFSISYLTL